MMTRHRHATLAALVVAVVAAWPAPSAGQAPAVDNPLGLVPHHITASATDVDRAAKWYQEMLGFRLDVRGSRNNGAVQFAELSIPGYGVALVQQATSPTAPIPEGPQRNRWVHPVFAVVDPDATFKILTARGAKPRTRGNASPITTFLVDDSEGNEIEIVKSNAISP